jgi:hypothetical protein
MNELADLLDNQMEEKNSVVIRNESLDYQQTDGSHGQSTDLLKGKYSNFTQNVKTLTVEDLKGNRDLSFEVGKYPIRDEFGGGGPERRYKGKMMLCREDNGFRMGLVKDTHNPLQNTEMIDMISPFEKELNAKLAGAGSLDGGRNIFALLKMDHRPLEPIAGDEVHGYYHVKFRHGNPNEIIDVSPVTLRLACSNGMVSFNENNIAIPYSCRTDEVLPYVQEKAVKTVEDLLQMESDFKSMSEVEFRSEEDLEIYFLRSAGKTWNNPAEIRRLEAIEDPEAREEALGFFYEKLQRSRKFAQRLYSVFAIERGSLPENKRDTVWAGYNTITNFTSHVQGSSGAARFKSNYYAGGAKTRQRGYKLGMEYVEAYA